MNKSVLLTARDARLPVGKPTFFEWSTSRFNVFTF
jgi:hypothetical protein